MSNEFDYGNARANVPSSFLRPELPAVEDTAPTCRGYYDRDRVFVPLNRRDDELCDATGCPPGHQWQSWLSWDEDRERMLRRVGVVSDAWVADFLRANTSDQWERDDESGTWRHWPRRSWESPITTEADIGPQSASPSSVGRVDAQSRDAARQVAEADGGMGERQ